MNSAWTGQAVPLIVTLFSPGPFSGTAAFDLPELPRTAFVKAGNPLVGSEEVDDENYFTQRHEFTVYTQRSGEIVIPSFRVRFSGKKSFTSDPEPMIGATQELRFQSHRPPGTESMGVVISATTMQIRQTWNPEPAGEIDAGDVVVRTVTRLAEGTTAMMLPPVSADAPEGVQVYPATPEVQDKVERGDASARRVDTVKYQFQRAGTCALPDLTFTWWDSDQEGLRSEVLPGLTINVLAASTPEMPPDEVQDDSSSTWTYPFIGLLVMALPVWFLRKPLGRWITGWRVYRNRPEAVAARRLRVACMSDDASAAYAALMAWSAARRTTANGGSVDSPLLALEQHDELREQWEALSQHLFAPEPAGTTWSGGQLWNAFRQSRSRRNRGSHRQQPSALPALNPTHSPRLG
jgi:hypothetical protein